MTQVLTGARAEPVALPRRGALVLPALAAALAGGALAGLAQGAVPVPPVDVLAVLLGAVGLDLLPAADPLHAHVVLGLRLPRVLLGAVVGAALGVAGALVQGWFRNPLAEPGLLGVSGGASLGAAAAIVLDVDALGAGAAAVPVAAFTGGLLAVLVVHHVARVAGRGTVVALLLAGLALQAVTAAGVGLLVTVADDDALRDLSFWTLGSVGGATWDLLAWSAPPLLLGLAAAWRLIPSLDALLLGERTAQHLGVDLDRVRRGVAVLVAVLVGVAVAACGPVAFLGLMAPHLVRVVAGPRHRVLVPGAALAGAALLVVGDVIARTAAAPVEIPIGVLTTLLGGPLFLALLLRRRGGLP